MNTSTCLGIAYPYNGITKGLPNLLKFASLVSGKHRVTSSGLHVRFSDQQQRPFTSSRVPQAWISVSGNCFFWSFALCAFHQEKSQWAKKGAGLGGSRVETARLGMLG